MQMTNNYSLRPFRLALVSFVGAVVLEIVLTFSVGLRDAFTVRQVPGHLAALLVGALVGWLFELFREITANAVETLRVAKEMQIGFEALTAKIKYQDEALSMLLKCPRHNYVLSQLVKASISENFRNIPLVGTPSYLAFLRGAVVHSDGYEGIQRKPLSWFKNTGGLGYLDELKRRSMRYKTRLIVIDEADINQWRADLQDDECLEYYWDHTGFVATYWMTAENFLATFPEWRSVPTDLALYDRQLLISYEEQSHLLRFDVVDESSEVPRLFESIDQLAAQSLPVLHKLKMPEGSAGQA